MFNPGMIDSKDFKDFPQFNIHWEVLGCLFVEAFI